MELCDSVYRITEQFPSHELFRLTSQLRGSAISIASNIAEGEGRFTRGERRQFLGHARGSLYELETQLLIAQRAGYDVVPEIFESVRAAKSALNGYIAYVQKH